MNLLSKRPARPVSTKPAPGYPKQWGMLALAVTAFAACTPTVKMGDSGSGGSGGGTDSTQPAGGGAACFSEGEACATDSICCDGLHCGPDHTCSPDLPTSAGVAPYPYTVPTSVPVKPACLGDYQPCSSDEECCNKVCGETGYCGADLGGGAPVLFDVDGGATAPLDAGTTP